MSDIQKFLLLTFIFATYIFYGFLAISDKAKASNFYYLGALLPLMANLLWLVAAKRMSASESVAFGGWWDLAVSISYPVAALLLSGVNFTLGQYVGIAMFVLGGIAFKF